MSHERSRVSRPLTGDDHGSAGTVTNRRYGVGRSGALLPAAPTIVATRLRRKRRRRGGRIRRDQETRCLEVASASTLFSSAPIKIASPETYNQRRTTITPLIAP